MSDDKVSAFIAFVGGLSLKECGVVFDRINTEKEKAVQEERERILCLIDTEIKSLKHSYGETLEQICSVDYAHGAFDALTGLQEKLVLEDEG